MYKKRTSHHVRADDEGVVGCTRGRVRSPLRCNRRGRRGVPSLPNQPTTKVRGLIDLAAGFVSVASSLCRRKHFPD